MSILPNNRQFKEIKPDKPASHLIGNKFAAKPPEERKTKNVFIEMTEAERTKCDEAAKIQGLKITPWARKTLLDKADMVKAGNVIGDSEWYSKALEILSPLRWHIHQLTEALDVRNALLQSMGKELIVPDKLAAAKVANEAVNEFFSPSKNKKPCQKIQT